MSETGRTVPDMNEPLSRYNITVAIGCDGGCLPDPAAFAAAADQAASGRYASIVSVHLADKFLGEPDGPGRCPGPPPWLCRPVRGSVHAWFSPCRHPPPLWKKLLLLNSSWVR